MFTATLNQTSATPGSAISGTYTYAEGDIASISTDPLDVQLQFAKDPTSGEWVALIPLPGTGLELGDYAIKVFYGDELWTVAGTLSIVAAPTGTVAGDKWRVIAAPTAWPVTWAQAKAHLRLDTDEQQSYVETLVEAVTDYAEDRLSASLMPRTIEATFYANERMELPRGPIIEVLSVIDANDVTLTDFEFENYGHTTRVVVNESGEYPIRITYRAGYASASSIPAAIRLAMLTHVATLYENRESVSDKAKLPVPHSLEDFYRLKARKIGVG